jgi:hypothetical protein
MRMLMHVDLPVDKFNAAVRDGTVGKKIETILEDARPEAVYFSERDGRRGAVVVIDVGSPSDIPKFAEPWFLHFDAKVEFRICMTPDDLASAGLDELGARWG